MLLLIDNYDSFTFNLRHALVAAGADEVRIARNDSLTVAEVAAMGASAIVLSPGPGGPAQAGICVDLVRTLALQRPILGVCLGLQCIGAAFGARVRAAHTLRHGKTSPLRHDGTGLFAGLANPLTVARYHSLVLDEATIQPPLAVTARADDGEVMAIEARGVEGAALVGVQFHPESYLTPQGVALLANFLQMVRRPVAALSVRG